MKIISRNTLRRLAPGQSTDRTCRPRLAGDVDGHADLVPGSIDDAWNEEGWPPAIIQSTHHTAASKKEVIGIGS